jgi:DNA-directed RNA polymerase specialized sigma subunit
MPASPTTNKQLTPRMRELVKAVAALTEKRGIPPTITEVAGAMGVSASRVQQLRDEAEARGGLVCDRRIPRSMRLANPSRR